MSDELRKETERLIAANLLPKWGTGGDHIVALQYEIYRLRAELGEAEKAIGMKSESIRVRLCKAGSFHGIKPKKLPNGRLAWPDDAVQKFLEQGR